MTGNCLGLSGRHCGAVWRRGIIRGIMIHWTTFIFVAALAICCMFDSPAGAADQSPPKSPLDFTVVNIDGKPTDLSQYKGQVVLIVNVASKCGFTPQYAGLEQLYKQFHADGFVILGFPANNFMHQEPGTNEQIKQFCTAKYDVTFPMMAKISVKGKDKAPLYRFLTEKPTARFPGEISWNFNKFLIGRDGQVIARYETRTKPLDPKVVADVQAALAKS